MSRKLENELLWEKNKIKIDTWCQKCLKQRRNKSVLFFYHLCMVSSQVALAVKNSPAAHLCIVVICIDTIRYFLPRLCHFSLASSFSVLPFSLQLPQSRQELSYWSSVMMVKVTISKEFNGTLLLTECNTELFTESLSTIFYQQFQSNLLFILYFSKHSGFTQYEIDNSERFSAANMPWLWKIKV